MRTTLVGATIKYSTNALFGRLADRYAIYLCSLDVKVYHKVALGVADCPAVSFRFVYLQQSQVIFQVIHKNNFFQKMNIYNCI